MPPSAPSPLFDRQLHVKNHLLPIERSAAVVLTRIGETQQQAAEQIGTTRQTVAHWQHTFAATGDVKDEGGRGRKRKTSEEEDIDIVASSVIDPHLTSRQLQKELELEVSWRTIDGRLQRAGLFGRVARKKRIFSDEEKKKRISFAEGYKSWTVREWSRVIFADEAIIQGEGGCKGGQQWVRRPVGEMEAFKDEYVQHKLPHPKQINIWGCVSAVGPGHSYIYNTSITAKEYANILNTHLLPSADLFFTESPRQQWYFLQDNAPIHKAQITQALLHNKGVTCIDFPPYSPDLNPIENVWEYIEKQVEQQRPNTIDELQDVLAEEWKHLPQQLLYNIVSSLQKRCLDVIQAGGAHIHY